MRTHFNILAFKLFLALLFLLLFAWECAFSTINPKPVTMVRAQDGMEMVLIADQNASNPVAGAEITPFWIDKFEVTNQQYEGCVNLGYCSQPNFVNSSTRDSYYGNEEFATYPVIYVDWDQARRYCESVNARLPLVEEWVKAAGGHSDQGRYPWGEKIPASNLANFNQQAGDTVAVGSYTAGTSPYGVFDMAGNVWEWIDSFRGKNPDCCGFNPLDENQIIHGGSWRSDAESLLNEDYTYKHYQTSGDDVGFRCVMDAED